MLQSCLKCTELFLTLCIFFVSLVNPVYASHQCGNGSCQPGGHHNESCSTCPADCGICAPTPSPTRTPTPSPTPTSTPGPFFSPTPEPTSSPDSSPSPTSTNSPTTTSPPGSSPTPISTSTSVSTSSQSNTQSTTYYPSVNLTSYSPDPTNRRSLTFTGTATIEQGIIQVVEYTVTDGAEWLSAYASDGKYDSSNELFSFTTPDFAEGSHIVKVRAKSTAGVTTQSEYYGSDTVTIVITPPSVILDKINPNPTKKTQPELTGSAISNVGLITRTEVSLDGGQTFLPTKLTGSRFTITTEELEDGNYQVVARAFDNAGNVGRSVLQTLVVDTIPPIIGGVEQSIGPQVLTSDTNGYISLVAGVETMLAVSMKGGVTEAAIKSGNNIFPFIRVPNSNIWVGKMNFDTGGFKKLSIEALDGAQNKTERLLNTVYVEEIGKVVNKDTQLPVANAKVTVFFFERILQQWILWEAASYGQTNPQQATNRGGYSFMLPSGKYYLEVSAPGFNNAQSEIFELSTATVVNYPLQLTSRPKIELKLPIVGNIVWSLPQLSPPDSIRVTDHVPVAPLQPLYIDSKFDPDNEKLSLLNLEGKEVPLERFRGKKLLLTFISPWSSLSQEQAPFLTETSSALSSDQQMLVVMLQEGVSTTRAFMKRGNHTFPVVADKDGMSANAYHVILLPYHVFIDAKEKIHSTHTGVLNKNELLTILNDVP